MNELANQKEKLKIALAEGLDVALKNLGEALLTTSPKYNVFIQLRSRYQAYLSAVMVGGDSIRELEPIYNGITHAYLLLVDSLLESDLKPLGIPAAAPQRKRGELLYNIPHAMQLDREHACRVRVAYLLEQVFEGWQPQPEDVQRGIRVAEVMAVELLNISENQAFAIRAVTESVQFLDEDSATEWLFYVRPKRLGELPLLLKISVIEIHNGREVRKDVVIEEHIIVAGEAVEEPTDFKKSGVEVAFQTAEKQEVPASRGIETVPPPAPAVSPAVFRVPFSVRRAMALFLVFLMVGTVGTFAMTNEIERGYLLARIQNSESAYTDFIEEFKNEPEFVASPEREKAYFRRAVVSDEPLLVRAYLDSVATPAAAPSENRLAVVEKLKTLENKAVESLEKNPTPELVKNYTVNFPEMARLTEVVKIVEKNPEVAAEALPVLENAAVQQISRRPQPEAVRNYAINFPEMKRLPEVVKIVEKNPAVAAEALPILEKAAVEQVSRRAAEPEQVKIYLEVLPASEPLRQEVEKQPVLKSEVSQELKINALKPQTVDIQKLEGKTGQVSEPKKEEKKTENPPAEPTKRTSKTGFDMVDVEGGTFTMGSPENEKGRNDDECQHQVKVKSFKISRYEVTQADWREVMGNNPSDFKDCNDCPVESVSWDDIQDFLKKANEKFPGKNFRLPTEAEWEFAARGGNGSGNTIYSGSDNLGEVAWHSGNSDDKTHPVGLKKANELGIFDMSGNVWEWCNDIFKAYACEGQGHSSGAIRVYRGGGWGDEARNCRAADRNGSAPADRGDNLGFRLARAF